MGLDRTTWRYSLKARCDYFDFEECVLSARKSISAKRTPEITKVK